jgi:hypothetical protein
MFAAICRAVDRAALKVMMLRTATFILSLVSLCEAVASRGRLLVVNAMASTAAKIANP